MKTKMKTVLFAVAVLTVAALAMIDGYLMAPDPYSLESALMANFKSWRGTEVARDLKESVDLVRALDEGEYAKIRQELNWRIDGYLVHPSFHALNLSPDNRQYDPYPVADTLTALARHRIRHPVTYDNAAERCYISNLLQKALGKERAEQNQQSEGIRR